MLTKKPYFTYRIEASGALYEAKINGILLEDNFEGNALNFEQPVNQYMRTGINRIGIQVYPYERGDFGTGRVTITLYVNQDGASESKKKMVGQITFNAAEFFKNKQVSDAIQTSMPKLRLDSANDLIASESGDVIIQAAVAESSKVEDDALWIYQDIELDTPFPVWGFFKADKLDFPDVWEDFVKNGEYYKKNLLTPLYQEHEKVIATLKTQDFNKILPLFEERNSEYDIALYYPEGTYNEMLKKSLQDDFNDKSSELKLNESKYARPTVSDDKGLIRLGTSAMIRFVNEEHSLYSKYPIWFYKKDGKWIISR
ncbi:hypothetical protein [Psychromonas sp. Urea-02u-13]|uniref:hypothetical protein n=1 Tax=Psychromonas sp. Urea-02u-13 TaxID=2058326 RepID=UPI0012FF583B|nr:hypothetical protein [Psychromonas sp. Urea-02u-13]